MSSWAMVLNRFLQFFTIFPGKPQEYLLERCLRHGVILDTGELRLDALHAAEQRVPGGGGVGHVEVDVVKVFISNIAVTELGDH